jgi:hypothetical protein
LFRIKGPEAVLFQTSIGTGSAVSTNRFTKRKKGYRSVTGVILHAL